MTGPAAKDRRRLLQGQETKGGLIFGTGSLDVVPLHGGARDQQPSHSHLAAQLSVKRVGVEGSLQGR